MTELSRVLMAAAAYTGLRPSEIVGLQWGDYDGKTISVRRNICFGQRGEMSVELPRLKHLRLPSRSSHRFGKFLMRGRRRHRPLRAVGFSNLASLGRSTPRRCLTLRA